MTSYNFRLVASMGHDGRMVKTYYNHGLNEYIVRLFINGVHYSPADYYTEDKLDALDTAKEILRRNCNG